MATLVREFPGHWWTDGASATWLTDAEVDVSGLGAGTLPVTFTAHVEVPAGGTAVLEIRSGGAATEVGSTVVASATQVGPYSGPVQGSSVAGVTAPSGKVLLHLVGTASDSAHPFEADDVLVEIG